MHYVYAIGASDGPTKIGFTGQPVNRIAAIQHASAYKLVHRFFAFEQKADAVAIELAVQSALQATRCSGEWFSVPLADAAECIIQTAGALAREVDITPPPRLRTKRLLRAERIGLRLSPALKAQIEALAAEDDVTLSKWLERAAKEAAERRRRAN